MGPVALDPRSRISGPGWTVGNKPGEAPGGVPSHRVTLPNSQLSPWLCNVSPGPTDGAKRRPLGFELTLLFCKCEFYKALYN